MVNSTSMNVNNYRLGICNADSASVDSTPQIADYEIALAVQNVTKVYKLYDSPMDRLKEALHPLRRKYHHDFFALNDISFEVKKGETFGVIGKNGSGKSTLLKIVSGILSPTEGSVMVNGRVSTLLELGAGFNPELSGIENIYFNGALMGYVREDMDAKLDEILSFADIGCFVHQPIKMYSSGMFVRLAFAVAVNIEPDIFIVDEALAVGDLRFQKKCKEKMNEIRMNGATVMLVSHNMADIKTLCHRAIVLSGGNLVYLGEAGQAINQYLKEENKGEQNSHLELPHTYGGQKGGTGDINICSIKCFQKGNDKDNSEIEYLADFVVEIDFVAHHKIVKPIFRINFSISGFQYFANIDSNDNGLSIEEIYGSGKICFEIFNQKFYPRYYKLNVGVVTEDINSHLFFWQDACSFVIRPPTMQIMSSPTALISLDSNISLEVSNVL